MSVVCHSVFWLCDACLWRVYRGFFVCLFCVERVLIVCIISFMFCVSMFCVSMLCMFIVCLLCVLYMSKFSSGSECVSECVLVCVHMSVYVCVYVCLCTSVPFSGHD